MHPDSHINGSVLLHNTDVGMAIMCLTNSSSVIVQYSSESSNTCTFIRMQTRLHLLLSGSDQKPGQREYKRQLTQFMYIIST